MSLSVWDEFDILIGLESYRNMLVLIAALPFAANFTDEWNAKVTANCVTRKSAEDYACANVIMCFISAFMTVFVSYMIYALFRSASMPIYIDDFTYMSHGLTTDLLLLTGKVFVYASSCAAWAVMGLAASAFFPSKYIAVCSPFMFSYIFERLTKHFPDRFNLPGLAKSSSDMEPLPEFLWANFIFMFIAAACGVIFIIKVKRRVENELS